MSDGTQDRQVVVTGIGLVTPFGVGVEALWSGLVERRSAVRRIDAFDTIGLAVDHAGCLPRVPYEQHVDRRTAAWWGTCSRLAVFAAAEALRDAAAPQPDARRAGVVLGTGYGGMYEAQAVYAAWQQRGPRGIRPTTVPQMMANAPASHVAMHAGFRGVNLTLSNACASGALALVLAAREIRAGRLDLCLAGGADVLLNASLLAAWCALRVLSRRNDPSACRPFSVDRDGLVLAEGAAMLVLEELGQARARGAPIRAVLRGVAANNDAHDVVEPDARGAAEALSLALADAGVAAGAVDFVNAHGTGTRANDAAETRALKAVFGPPQACPPTFSVKGHLGHAMGAAGAIEAAVTVLALQRQILPPTLGFTPGDPECDLDYVSDGPRPARLVHGLSNSFGFGGQNAVLLFGAFE